VRPKRRSVGPLGCLAGHERAIQRQDHPLREGSPISAPQERDPKEHPGANSPRQCGETVASPAQTTTLVGQTSGGLLR